MYTENEEKKKKKLALLAKREQKEESREVSAHGSKQTKTEKDQIEYIVSSFRDIGPKTRTALLEEFDTIQNLVNASEEELTAVSGVGDKTAQYIVQICRKNYSELSE